ncbi:hypothetical protein Patl1_05194 [Pistacia atlantica]|uniref:Uncharacterized protein n=1 Tax=Pistacia atlantica TaxID=434234 RepID=A0ACC1BPZ3_9ROSI|nr:hypothetical protein Patl1_05194 [Pistacia atlantica]
MYYEGDASCYKDEDPRGFLENPRLAESTHLLPHCNIELVLRFCLATLPWQPPSFSTLLLSAVSLATLRTMDILVRKAQVGVRLYSEHCLNCITFFYNCRQKQNCNIKLYMIPDKAIAGHRWSRQFASIGSLETNVDVSSGVCDPDDFQRYKTMRDHSSNHLNGISDFERQLQELFDEVKTMIMKGNKNDAIDLLQANYQAVKEQINAGTKGIEEAAILDIIALGYVAIGDLKFINEVVDSLKNEEPLLDGILIHMGSMYSMLGKFEKSMLVYRRVISILENRYGKYNLETSLCSLCYLLE